MRKHGASLLIGNHLDCDINLVLFLSCVTSTCDASVAGQITRAISDKGDGNVSES